MTARPRQDPFNGPVETGMRAVLVLYACYPKVLDIQRLTALDYLLVRTGLLGGPIDMHPPTPIMTPVTQVRRKAVHEALNLMISRGLVDQKMADGGIYYQAGDYAAFFVESLSSSYAKQMQLRANWIAGFFDTYSEIDFDSLMNELLADWVAEFQDGNSVNGLPS